MKLVNYYMDKGIGGRLRQLRKNLDLSQAEAAVKLGTYQQRYAHWETGHTRPDPDELKKIADVFGVSSDWLLGRKASMAQEEQAEYVSSHPTDSITTELLLTVHTLDLEAKKAVLQYAKEKGLVAKMKGSTDKKLRDALDQLRQSPIGQAAERKRKRERKKIA